MTAPVHYVVLDACALMPTILRRLLLRVAAEGAYLPVWSARIGDEWRRNAARLWQMPLADLEAEWATMNAAWPEADPGDLGAYEIGLKYSDPKDWHVIAAGLARRARSAHQRATRVSVMTWNLKDFNTGDKGSGFRQSRLIQIKQCKPFQSCIRQHPRRCPPDS